ncbi:hypothetical protein [Endothiovibrio diazotrophicus]
MAEEKDYTNDSQQAALAVLDLFGRFPLYPFSITEVQEHVGISRDQAFRTLWNLARAGWIEEMEKRGYRLAPRLTTYAETFRRDIAELAQTYLERGAQ